MPQATVSWEPDPRRLAYEAADNSAEASAGRIGVAGIDRKRCCRSEIEKLDEQPKERFDPLGLPVVARPPEELDLVRIEEHLDEREPNAIDYQVVSADAGDRDIAGYHKLCNVRPFRDRHVDVRGVDVKRAAGPGPCMASQGVEAAQELGRLQSDEMQFGSIPDVDLNREPVTKFGRQLVR